jgi:hypothetical protein
MTPLPRALAPAATAAIVCVLALGGCDAVNEESYEQIATGMTIAQVEDILGKGTREDTGGASISGAGIGASRTDFAQKVYSWKAGNNQIIVTFVDGKVVGKSKRGF